MRLIYPKFSWETSVSPQMNTVNLELIYGALLFPLKPFQMMPLPPPTSSVLTVRTPSYYPSRVENAWPPKPRLSRLSINKSFTVINYHTVVTHNLIKYSWNTSNPSRSKTNTDPRFFFTESVRNFTRVVPRETCFSPRGIRE
jgi:hypothetical protein